ncbi:MAG: type I restriction enzyme R subunit, partial [Candidatus Promineifilaceae bacterium]
MWVAYQLIELYQAGADRPLFDSVIIVTDRRVLDKQLRDNVSNFSAVKNIIAPAHSSRDLRLALENNKRIITTTIQKFPFIVDAVDDLSDKNFAVIIDEAHSSQSGQAHDKMNMSLGAKAADTKSDEDEEGKEDEDEFDYQDEILKVMKGRKLGGNTSYFAFTATPKNATLEKFGQLQEDGSFRPFHLYSMKQAIEEGFILDVLGNYTTYRSYYEIIKSTVDNPLFDTLRAQKKLRAFVEGDKETIQVKAEIMVNHFLENVVQAKRLKGQAKGMVVTRNITTAIRYYQAIKKELEKQNCNFQAIVAFSGKKKVDGVEYTEDHLNGFPSKDIGDKLDTADYRLLVVANKFLTGFDQPKLTTMYVDKKLKGVLAVQALSRLNRANLKLGKRPEDIFILDFMNKVEDIKVAFDPFYTATSLSNATDVNVLHDLKENLDSIGVYEKHEVEEFNQKFWTHIEGDELSALLDHTAVERFDHELELDQNQKADFKIKAKQFVKVYSQVAGIMPYEMLVWEKLFWYLKFLIPKLNVKDPNADLVDELLQKVDLSTYGLARVKLGHKIELDSDESELDPAGANPRGVHDEPQKDPLDEIIEAFNDRFFDGWDQEAFK